MSARMTDFSRMIRACAWMFETLGIVLLSDSRYSSPPIGPELPAVDEHLSKRDLVDRLAAARQLGHRLEDLGVGLAVEVLDRQRLDDDVHRLVLEEDAPRAPPAPPRGRWAGPGRLVAVN